VRNLATIHIGELFSSEEHSAPSSKDQFVAAKFPKIYVSISNST